MPGDLDFGPVLGSIWGPFWDHFGVKHRFESDWKKQQKKGWKKVTQAAPGHAGNWPWGSSKGSKTAKQRNSKAAGQKSSKAAEQLP